MRKFWTKLFIKTKILLKQKIKLDTPDFFNMVAIERQVRWPNIWFTKKFLENLFPSFSFSVLYKWLNAFRLVWNQFQFSPLPKGKIELIGDFYISISVSIRLSKIALLKIALIQDSFSHLCMKCKIRTNIKDFGFDSLIEFALNTFCSMQFSSPNGSF